MLGGSSRLQVQLRFLQALFKASNLVFGRRGCDRSHPRWGAGPHGSPSNRVGTAGLAHPRFWNSNIIGCAATAGHWLIVIAFRFGDASVLAPFTYTQLVWSTTLGAILFGAVPDVWTLLGASAIVASGLYTAHREQVRARERLRGKPREN